MDGHAEADDESSGTWIGRLANIPDLSVESQPIVPGTYQTVTFRADRPGVYTYYCNVLCSHRHGAMVGKLVVKRLGATSP